MNIKLNEDASLCAQNHVLLRLFRQVKKETFEKELIRAGTFGNTALSLKKNRKINEFKVFNFIGLRALEFCASTSSSKIF